MPDNQRDRRQKKYCQQNYIVKQEVSRAKNYIWERNIETRIDESIIRSAKSRES